MTNEAGWEIDPSRSWPPSGKPSAPVSPSLYEALTECPLRACFGCSPGYGPRTSPRTRLGTAYHDTLARLPSLSISGLTRRGMRDKAVTWFREELAVQRARAERHLRERALTWPEEQIQAMEISLALKTNDVPVHLPLTRNVEQQVDRPQENYQPHLSTGPSLREQPLVSRDGLVCGRPDLIESGPSGGVVVDYKTGSLDAEETRARYVRQCLVYAWLWHDQPYSWPATYRIENPILGQVYEDAVDQDLAAKIVSDMRRIAQQMPLTGPSTELARTGDHCGHCAYRPWCEPYWLWIGGASPAPTGEGDTQFMSLEGRLLQVAWPPNATQNVGLFYLQSKETRITIQVSLDKFSYLRSVPPGRSLRVIDAATTYDVSWLKLTPWSEVYVLPPR